MSSSHSVSSCDQCPFCVLERHEAYRTVLIVATKIKKTKKYKMECYSKATDGPLGSDEAAKAFCHLLGDAIDDGILIGMELSKTFSGVKDFIVTIQRIKSDLYSVKFEKTEKAKDEDPC